MLGRHATVRWEQPTTCPELLKPHYLQERRTNNPILQRTTLPAE